MALAKRSPRCHPPWAVSCGICSFETPPRHLQPAGSSSSSSSSTGPMRLSWRAFAGSSGGGGPGQPSDMQSCARAACAGVPMRGKRGRAGGEGGADGSHAPPSKRPRLEGAPVGPDSPGSRPLAASLRAVPKPSPPGSGASRRPSGPPPAGLSGPGRCPSGPYRTPSRERSPQRQVGTTAASTADGCVKRKCSDCEELFSGKVESCRMAVRSCSGSQAQVRNSAGTWGSCNKPVLCGDCREWHIHGYHAARGWPRGALSELEAQRMLQARHARPPEWVAHPRAPAAPARGGPGWPQGWPQVQAGAVLGGRPRGDAHIRKRLRVF